MSSEFQKGIFAKEVLFEDGWHQNSSIYFSQDGTIESVRENFCDENLMSANGPVIPGMINVHSHAFQRGLCGKTQNFDAPGDDFWSWREAMYQFVDTVTPEGYRVQAELLFIEMIRNGYTTVCEFHYLHHAPDGAEYEELTVMSHMLADAAAAAGLRLCLLPVIYIYGGFSNKALHAGQLRFGNSTDQYFRIMDGIEEFSASYPLFSLGYAPHSLRAVGEPELREMLGHRASNHPQSPVHVHIAEQAREVQDCLAEHGARPLEWLMDNFEVTSDWCLIHATHIDRSEIRAIQDSQAVVGLCPTTEADLGDGIFPFRSFVRGGGRFAIGSDSNVSLSPNEELRLLEYTQRLVQEKRNIDGMISSEGAATRRYMAAVQGGRQASGMSGAIWKKGSAADLVILNERHPVLQGLAPDDMLNAHLFSGSAETIDSVIIAGRSVI